MAFDWATAFQQAPKATQYTPYRQNDDRRGVVDRLLDGLQVGQYAVMGGLDNMTDGNPNTGVIEGIRGGFRAGNPFGKGYEEGEAMFSDVLGNVGWNPESGAGKFAKGAVGLAGDIFLDPLTYVNPFSAASKVVKGTGTVVKGKKGVVAVNELTMRDAQHVIDEFYKARGINPKTLPEADYVKEVQDLMDSYNKKVLKTRHKGEDFQIGMKNLPFTDKVKIGDKTLASFTRNIVDADTLRKFGDKTVAPYYNALTNKIRSSKVGKKFDKYEDFLRMDGANQLESALYFKASKAIKGFDPKKMAKDLEVMTEGATMSKVWDGFTKEEKVHFRQKFEKGGFYESFREELGLASKVDKVKGTKTATEAVIKKHKDLAKAGKDFKAETDKVDSAVEVIKKNKHTPTASKIEKVRMDLDSIGANIAKIDDDFIDKGLREGFYDDQIRQFLKEADELPDNIAYEDLKGFVSKTIEDTNDLELQQLRGTPDLAVNKFTDGMMDDTVNVFPVEEYRDLFATGGVHAKEFKKQYIFKDIGKENVLQKIVKDEKTGEMVKQKVSLKEGMESIGLNTGVIDEGSKLNLRKTFNDEFFDGKDVFNADVQDSYVVKFAQAIQKNDVFEVEQMMEEIAAAHDYSFKASSSDLFRLARQRAGAVIGQDWIKMYDKEGVVKRIKPKYRSQFIGKREDEIWRPHSTLIREYPLYKAFQDGTLQEKLDAKLMVLNGQMDVVQKRKALGDVTLTEGLEKELADKIKLVEKQKAFNWDILKSAFYREKYELGLSKLDDLLKVNPKMMDDFNDVVHAQAVTIHNNVYGGFVGINKEYASVLDTPATYAKQAEAGTELLHTRNVAKQDLNKPAREIVKSNRIEQMSGEAYSDALWKENEARVLLGQKKISRYTPDELEIFNAKFVEENPKYADAPQLKPQEEYENFHELAGGLGVSEDTIKKMMKATGMERDDVIQELAIKQWEQGRALKESMGGSTKPIDMDELGYERALRQQSNNNLGLDPDMANDIKLADDNIDLNIVKTPTTPEGRSVMDYISKDIQPREIPQVTRRTPLDNVLTPTKKTLKTQYAYEKPMSKTEDVKIDWKYGDEFEKPLPISKAEYDEIMAKEFDNPEVYAEAMNKVDKASINAYYEVAKYTDGTGIYHSDPEFMKQALKNVDLTPEEVMQKSISKSNVEDIKEAYKAEDMPEIAEAIEGLEEAMKLTPEEAVSGVDALDVRMDKLARWIFNNLDEVGRSEVLAKNLSREQWIKMRYNYLPHMMTDEGKRFAIKNLAKEFEATGGFNPSVFAAGWEKRFNQHRTIKGGIDKANEYFKNMHKVEQMFQDNVVDLVVARSLLSGRLLYNDEMTTAIKKIAGLPYTKGVKVDGHTAVVSFVDLHAALKREYNDMIPDEALSGLGIRKEFFTPNNAYIPMTDEHVQAMYELLGKGEKRAPEVFMLRDEMMVKLNRESMIQKRMHQSQLLNVYDKFLIIYKMWNSAINPGFHFQNSASNAFQIYMSNSDAFLNPKKYKQAIDIFNNSNSSKTIKMGDREITYKHIRELSEQYGLLDNTFFKKDVRFGVEDGGALKKKFGVSGKIDPTDINEFVPYKVGARVGSEIEGVQRLVLFVDCLENGSTIEEAISTVNKFLFDYSDLTQFEKDYMKRIIPFYTFMRKNVPLQLEMMIDNPNLYRNVDKGFDEWEAMSGDDYVPDSQRNEWRKDSIQMPFKIDGEKIAFNPQLPYQQLDRLAPNRILGQSSPVIKTPIEAMTGKYLYTGIDIDSPLDYLMGQSTPTKTISISGKKDGKEKDLYVLSQLLGFPINTL